MKKFITQNLGICALSLYTLVAGAFLTFEFSMIENLPNNNKHLRYHQDFYVGYHLGDPSHDSLTSKKNVTTKKKRLVRSTKTNQSELNFPFFSQTVWGDFLGHIGESNSLYLFGGVFFIVLLPLVTFIGHRSRETLEERYHLKLTKISRMFLEEKDQELDLYAQALKNSEQKRTSILEKIFPEYSKISKVVEQFYSNCSKEIMDNFKARINYQVENKQETAVSVINSIKEIKSLFAHKIICQKISFEIKGEDISLHGISSSFEFILYYTIKKIMENLPREGSVEIILNNEKSPKIIIKDKGYYFSPEKLGDFHSLLNDKEQEFPVDPSTKDMEDVSKICGWDIKEKDRYGKFNVTEIEINPERSAHAASKIVYLKNTKLDISNSRCKLQTL